MKCRKKPISVDCVEFNGKNITECLNFLGQEVRLGSKLAKDKFYDYCAMVDLEGLKINTLEGVITAQKGDYIIKGVEGEFYPCKPEIFHKTYELLND